MPGHLCLLLPLLSLCAAPLGPLAGWWSLSGGGTRSAPLSASPRFLPPSAGQKNPTGIIKSTLPPSERKTQLSREDFVKTQPELITKAFYKAELLEYLEKTRKKSIVHHNNWHCVMRSCFPYSKENTTLGTACFILKPLSTSTSMS